MESIKDIVISVVQDLSTRKSGKGNEAPEAWLKKALTKKDFRHIKFHYFRKGILGMHVDSSSRLYSLSLQKEALLNRLKAESSSVQDIRFRLGEIK